MIVMGLARGAAREEGDRRGERQAFLAQPPARGTVPHSQIGTKAPAASATSIER